MIMNETENNGIKVVQNAVEKSSLQLSLKAEKRIFLPYSSVLK